MPSLYEGTLFFMPVTVPAPSISVVLKFLQLQDKILMKFPDVAQVFGKAGGWKQRSTPLPLSCLKMR